MRYLIKNVIGTVFIMGVNAIYGSSASENENLVILLLAITGSFVVTYVITWAKIGANNNFFESQSKDKISFYMFFRRSINLALFISIITIICISFLIFDNLILILI